MKRLCEVAEERCFAIAVPNFLNQCPLNDFSIHRAARGG